MAKRRGRNVRIELSVGEDEHLWRYGDIREALTANSSLLSRLIRAGEHQRLQDEPLDQPSEAGITSEGVV